eukprot:1180462-Prorocentrum_minimum.AAC.7
MQNVRKWRSMSLDIMGGPRVKVSPTSLATPLVYVPEIGPFTMDQSDGGSAAGMEPTQDLIKQTLKAPHRECSGCKRGGVTVPNGELVA